MSPAFVITRYIRRQDIMFKNQGKEQTTETETRDPDDGAFKNKLY